MSEHPCSRDHEGVPVSSTEARKGSDFPIVELDKGDPSLWQGRTPGDDSHWSPDHPLVITRASVKREEGDAGEQ